MTYVFRRGNTETEFTADTDVSAWLHVIENHSVSRTRAMPGETLYRVDRVPVERPTQERIDYVVKVMAASHNIKA